MQARTAAPSCTWHMADRQADCTAVAAARCDERHRRCAMPLAAAASVRAAPTRADSSTAARRRDAACTSVALRCADAYRRAPSVRRAAAWSAMQARTAAPSCTWHMADRQADCTAVAALRIFRLARRNIAARAAACRITIARRAAVSLAVLIRARALA